MAIKPELSKKPKARVIARDLKAKRNPKGGAQKKEFDLNDVMTDRAPNGTANPLL